MIGMIGHAERIIFCEGTYTRKHVVPELCTCIKVRVPHTRTNWPSINVHRYDLCRQLSIVAIRSASFNAPWFFLWGQQQQWIGWGGSVARPCWLIIAVTISNVQWGTGPTEHVLQKHAFFNKMICVQLSVLNSDPYGRTPSPAHNSNDMFESTCSVTKNDPIYMAYHPYHFVGEVLLHPV